MNKPMQLLILVLNKVECLDYLFEELIQIGVKGATVVDSKGMARIVGEEGHSIFGSLRMLVDSDTESSKMVFMAVNDDLVEAVRATVDRVLGGLHKPDTGVLFGLPISFFDGKVDKE